VGANSIKLGKELKPEKLNHKVNRMTKIILGDSPLTMLI
jgi:hypothetical protein